jgi:multidrug efflux pump subunit AcrA (membrane-fusion protein)
MAIGPKHMLPKLVIALVIGAACFVTFFKPMYHVSAPFQFAAIGKQPVSMPFEGKIESIGINSRTGKMLEPGDEVKKGDVLLTMDTKQLHEQLYAAQSKAAAARARADAARAVSNQPGKTAEYNEARKEAEASDAEARLYQLQVEEATVKAAFDGIIIRADNLDEKIGFAVKKGDVIMEVAPKGQYRAELAVSERDIQEIREGGVQHGKLATSSFPSDDIRFTIDRIVPNSDAKEGDNVFKVFATLDDKRDWIRPGMAGEARVDVEHRRLVWIWTHRLIDFLKLKLWM